MDTACLGVGRPTTVALPATTNIHHCSAELGSAGRITQEEPSPQEEPEEGPDASNGGAPSPSTHRSETSPPRAKERRGWILRTGTTAMPRHRCCGAVDPTSRWPRQPAAGAQAGHSILPVVKVVMPSGSPTGTGA